MSSPRLVLVVENIAELREVLTHAFEAEGYHVLTASDDAEARALLEAQDFDLVVADPPDGVSDALPGLERDYPDLPLILLSDTGRAPLYFGPWETSGVRRTLRRPFKLSDLIAAAREALGETAESG